MYIGWCFFFSCFWFLLLLGKPALTFSFIFTESYLCKHFQNHFNSDFASISLQCRRLGYQFSAPPLALRDLWRTLLKPSRIFFGHKSLSSPSSWHLHLRSETFRGCTEFHNNAHLSNSSRLSSPTSSHGPPPSLTPAPSLALHESLSTAPPKPS